MNNFVIFDIDGTLYKGQTHSTLTRLLLKHNFINYYDLISIFFPYLLYTLNLSDNIEKTRSLFYSKLKGLNYNALVELIKNEFSVIKNNIYKDSNKLIDNHKQKGDYIIAISASVDIIINEICKDLTIDKFIATRLEISDNFILTGKIKGLPVYGKNKILLLQEFFKNNQIKFNNIIFYTDHISDLDLLNYSNVQICVNPDNKLKKIAKIKNWEILNFRE